MRPALIVLAALLLPAGAANAGTPCADLNGGFETDIYAIGISCPAAHKVVRKWHRKAVDQGQGGGTKYVGDFYCLSFDGDPEHVQVRCADGRRKIRFYAGP